MQTALPYMSIARTVTSEANMELASNSQPSRHRLCHLTDSASSKYYNNITCLSIRFLDRCICGYLGVGHLIKSNI